MLPYVVKQGSGKIKQKTTKKVLRHAKSVHSNSEYIDVTML